MRFFILHTRTQVPFPSLLPNTLTLGLSIVQVTLPSSVPFSRGGSLLPLLFFISAQINALCSFSVSFSTHFKSTPFAHYSSRTEHSEEFPGCARSEYPLGYVSRVKPLGRTRSLSLRQLTRKRFGTKHIIRLLPALHISYKIYQFSQCHKQDNSDKCVNNHNSKY